MAQFPGLMLWTDAWVADTHHLSRDVRGAYMDLLIKMWRTPGCRVPNDDAWLARQLCMTAKEVVEILRPIIKEFCQTDGNWVFQKRLQREFVRAFQTQVLRKSRAKSGWAKRMQLDKTEANPLQPSPYGKTKRDDAHAMHPDQNRKIESLQYRAREEPEPEVAAEKKASKVSAELYQLVAAKRAAGEE
jgi:uncharacterized protein YdaU (DUF1376 family)